MIRKCCPLKSNGLSEFNFKIDSNVSVCFNTSNIIEVKSIDRKKKLGNFTFYPHLNLPKAEFILLKNVYCFMGFRPVFFLTFLYSKRKKKLNSKPVFFLILNSKNKSELHSAIIFLFFCVCLSFCLSIYKLR